jgi:hypothetical protein
MIFDYIYNALLYAFSFGDDSVGFQLGFDLDMGAKSRVTRPPSAAPVNSASATTTAIKPTSKAGEALQGPIPPHLVGRRLKTGSARAFGPELALTIRLRRRDDDEEAFLIPPSANPKTG